MIAVEHSILPEHRTYQLDELQFFQQLVLIGIFSVFRHANGVINAGSGS